MVRKKLDESKCPYCRRPKAVNRFMCDHCQKEIDSAIHGLGKW